MFADLRQAVEGCLPRHVHEQRGSDGRLRLAVAVVRMQQRVGLEHAAQLRLAKQAERPVPGEQLVLGELSIEILVDVGAPAVVVRLAVERLQTVQ